MSKCEVIQVKVPIASFFQWTPTPIIKLNPYTNLMTAKSRPIFWPWLITLLPNAPLTKCLSWCYYRQYHVPYCMVGACLQILYERFLYFKDALYWCSFTGLDKPMCCDTFRMQWCNRPECAGTWAPIGPMYNVFLCAHEVPWPCECDILLLDLWLFQSSQCASSHLLTLKAPFDISSQTCWLYVPHRLRKLKWHDLGMRQAEKLLERQHWCTKWSGSWMSRDYLTSLSNKDNETDCMV